MTRDCRVLHTREPSGTVLAWTSLKYGSEYNKCFLLRDDFLDVELEELRCRFFTELLSRFADKGRTAILRVPVRFSWS